MSYLSIYIYIICADGTWCDAAVPPPSRRDGRDEPSHHPPPPRFAPVCDPSPSLITSKFIKPFHRRRLMGIRAGRRTGEGRLRRFETVLIACDLIKSNSSEMTAAKLATCLLIRGGISKEAKGVRCRTAPGSLENPRFVRLTLAQCSNTPALTPHCLAPEANSVKRERKVGAKSRLLRRTGSKRPFFFWRRWE